MKSYLINHGLFKKIGVPHLTTLIYFLKFNWHTFNLVSGSTIWPYNLSVVIIFPSTLEHGFSQLIIGRFFSEFSPIFRWQLSWLRRASWVPWRWWSSWPGCPSAPPTGPPPTEEPTAAAVTGVPTGAPRCKPGK